MRVAPQEDRFSDALRKQVVLALRHHANESSEVLPGPLVRRPATDLGFPFQRRHRSKSDAYQRGLPAAVRSQHGVELARIDREGDADERISPGAGIPVANAGQAQHGCAFLRTTHPAPWTLLRTTHHALRTVVMRSSSDATAGQTPAHQSAR